MFSKGENKSATLQCAPQALFHFLFFASEQHILLNGVFVFVCFLFILEEASGKMMEMASKHIEFKNLRNDNIISTLHSLTFLVTSMRIP